MRVFHLLFGFNLLLLASFLGEATQIDGVYIVYMGAQRTDHSQLVSHLLMKRENDSLIHTYGNSFSGFAAHLSAEEANSIAQRPEVVSVFRDRALKLHTTRSWNFLMSQNAHFKFDSSPMSSDQFVSRSSRYGDDDTIIGVFDSGIWPEHPSFDDQFTGPIPPRWKGKCMPGNNSILFNCNRKLIGARYYDKPEKPGSTVTARDFDGHGTYVASIAAGSSIPGASYKGLAGGIARGCSPGLRIAAYNVCGADDDCPGSRILKAFDDAIADGVDVLSLSLGDEYDDFLTDPVAIGTFHAVEKGISVVCSVGNSGPSPRTVENFVPWILSVGATTIDRVFEVDIVLGGNSTRVIKGGCMNFSGLKKSAVYHLTDGRSASLNQTNVPDAINCVPGSLDDAKVEGKIILCASNDKHHLADKIHKLKKQGVIGIIYISSFLTEFIFDDYGSYPFTTVTEENGAKIQSYINSSSNPLATILPTKTTLNHKPAPVVPIFSSRGPPAHGIKNLIKPDVAAPGVNILGACPPSNEPGMEGVLFQIQSGTSSSCPHVSGLAATVKSWHPTWSPSAIRSAIMTTAIQTNNQHSPIKTDEGSRATSYDIGSGEINLFGPLWPGLVYETKTTDYVQFLCNMGYSASVIRTITSSVPNNFFCPCSSSPDMITDMNYPSIAVSGLKANGTRTVKRIVTNVGEQYSTYTAVIEAPAGVQVQVMPKILGFTKNVKTLTFQVSFKLTTTTSDQEVMFGSITWFNWEHRVRSPFVVSKV